jgi:hypothetical protein
MTSLKGLELGLRGQAPHPEKVGDFFERSAPRQLVNVVAPIDESALFTEDVTEGGRRGDDTLESLGLRQRGLV